MKYIDINCDLGEGIGNEVLLMPYLSSCSIACGGHAGDLDTMKRVSELAKQHCVKIGAHPSFPDKVGFGRQIIEISPSDLYKTLENQIKSLIEVLKSLNLELHHVKPHGALYNLASMDEKTARIVIDVIKSIDGNLILYAPYRSVVSEIAISEGVKVMFEGFADRNYNEDLTLVSRQNKAALIYDNEQVFEHVFMMISEEKVKVGNGVEVGLKVDTICVHGDHINVIKNLEYLTRKLMEKSIKIL